MSSRTNGRSGERTQSYGHWTCPTTGQERCKCHLSVFTGGRWYTAPVRLRSLFATRAIRLYESGAVERRLLGQRGFQGLTDWLTEQDLGEYAPMVRSYLEGSYGLTSPDAVLARAIITEYRGAK